MNDFLNPYIAGAPVVEPSMFFGRQDVFDWIEQNLSGRFVNHILVIHGQRRVGKTSVLKQIPNHLPPHFIHIFFDLQGRTHTSLDRFQWWLAREICRGVNQARGQTISIPDYELFAQDGEYLAATFLPDVLSRLNESILLLTFDEFDTLSEPEIQQTLARPLIIYLRRLFDLPKLNFIFSIGSSGHKLENMQASYTEFFKTALYRKISFLKQEDCSRLITHPVEGMLAYEIAAVDRIYGITSGHPYFTQLICHELFALSQKTGRRTITQEDVESVLEDVIERGTVNLKFVWDEASDLEKWVLSCLAHELHAHELDPQAKGNQSRLTCDDKQLASALHNQRVRFGENDLNTALVHLREKDVLTQQNRFVIELLSIWLLKNRPLDRVRDELVQVNPIANRYNEIGDEFHELGQMQKALESFGQALSTDPVNLRAQVSIANLHLEGENYPQAVLGYEAALRIDDDDIAARSGLSTALMALGEAAAAADKPAEAGEYYQRVLTTNPDHPEANQRLAALYTRLAEAALATGEAELALQHYARALEHAPDDNQLVARYALAREEHTRRLIDGLLKQSQQAQEQQDWQAALDVIQRAIQLAPKDPALLNRLAAVQDAPRLAQITNLQAHAQEMERDQRWDEAVHDWEACLQLKPDDEESVRQSLQVARRGQKMASDYSQAQVAIKEARYSQAIALLQGVIVQDAGYKDAASLLVECLKVRSKRKLKLPAGWWRWAVPAVILLLVIIGIVTQWPRMSTLLAGFGQSETPVATQAAINLPLATATAAGSTPPPTMTATGEEFITLADAIYKITGGKAPDVQEEFSATTLGEYWNKDDGAKKATLLDGALRMSNEIQIGKDVLRRINYLFQVDLRFGGLTGNEKLIYSLRVTPSPYVDLISGYQLVINPSKGTWVLMVLTDPNGEYTEVQKVNMGAIENGRWYELGVVVMNETFWVYWDNQLLFTQDNVNLFGTTNCFGLDPANAGEATLDIDNWLFWDLGTPEWMRSDWITSATPTFAEDNFEAGQGWQFSPEKYENGRAVLATNGSETYFSRDDFTAANIALEVTFSPRAFPDTGSLVWFIGKQTTGDTEGMLGFEYFPITGQWQIFKFENQKSMVMVSGWTQLTPKENIGMIMVFVNGDRLSAFYGDEFLSSVESDRLEAKTVNFLSVRSNGVEFAQVDLIKIRFWDLDAVEWKTSDWITAQTESVLIDSFTGNEGLLFYPEEDETYVDGKAALVTKSGTTSLSRDDLQGKYIALEVSFIPRSMPDSASLVWVLGEDATTLDSLEFSYFPKTGSWQINQVVNRQWEELSSGTSQPTPEATAVTIMVVTHGDQVRVYLNQEYIGSAEVDRSGGGTRNEVAIREKDNLYARADVYLIRFWDLGTVEQADGERTTAGEISESFAQAIEKMIGDKAPDFQDDFSTATLQDYWSNDKGAKSASLQEGALRLNNEYLVGDGILASMNYILAVNLRFDGFSADEIFVYGLRLTVFENGEKGTEYLLSIKPSSGDWLMKAITAPDGQYTEIKMGNLGAIKAGDWHQLGIVVNEQTIQVYWDDKNILYINEIKLYGLTNHFGLDKNSAGGATLDIDNWRFWDLGTSAFMRNDWITESVPTVIEDNFTPGEGWKLSGGDDEDLVGWVTLHTALENETGLTREDIFGTNFAMEVSFKSMIMPESASLVLFLRQDISTGEKLEFEYFSTTGFWQLKWTGNKTNPVITSGWTQPTLQESDGRIIVLVDEDQVSAFIGDTFLGHAEISQIGVGTWNEVIIRSNGAARAQVNLLEIGFWNLDAVDWKTSDWITAHSETVVIDNFTGNEGMWFQPEENVKYENGMLVVFTNEGESYFRREDLFGTNFAIELTFIPDDMPDSGSLLWQLGKNEQTGEYLTFVYYPLIGDWQISYTKDQQERELASGPTLATQKGEIRSLMVVANGDRVSAYLNRVSISTAIDIDRSGAGETNTMAVASYGGGYAQASILKIRFWDLDQ